MSSPAEKFLKHVANVVAERGTQYGDGIGLVVVSRLEATLAHGSDYCLLVSIALATGMPFPSAHRHSPVGDAVFLTPCGERG